MKNIFSQGVRLSFGAILFFSLMNICAKSLGSFSAYQLAFMRSVLVMLFCFSWLYQQKIDLKGKKPLILFLRGVFGSFALITFMMTLQQMPLATASMLQYISPIFTAILAYYILNEKLHSLQWIFLLVCLLGVFIIKGVDTRIAWSGVGLGLFSSFCAGLAYVSIRKLNNEENSVLVVFYFALVTSLLSGFLMFFSGEKWQIPQKIDWLYIIGMGIFTQFGQTLMTMAYQVEDASIVASVNYTGVIFGFVLGWFLFNEGFDLYTLAGMCIVMAGIILNVTFKSWYKVADRKV